MGADHIVDYIHEDFTRRPNRYDIVFDCHASHSLVSLRARWIARRRGPSATALRGKSAPHIDPEIENAYQQKCKRRLARQQ
jgi:hypothetical protein